MPPPGAEPGKVNVHAAWRIAVAERAARAYAGNRKLAALAVAGSVGAGLADRFSDLELDCYWSSPPGDADRTGPIGALGGELTGFWEYDPGDQEWSEDYLLGDLGVTVSNFLTGTVERFLDDVVLSADTSPVKHMRLAALQRSRPLLGAGLIPSWRARGDTFPRRVAGLVQHVLDPEMLRLGGPRRAGQPRGRPGGPGPADTGGACGGPGGPRGQPRIPAASPDQVAAPPDHRA